MPAFLRSCLLLAAGVLATVPSPAAAPSRSDADRLTAPIERLMQQWDLVGAFDLASRQLSIRLELLPPDDPDIATSEHTIGVILRDAGHRGRGAEQLAHALELRRRALGSDHPDVASTMIEYSRAFRLLGRLNEAETLLESARVVLEHAGAMEGGRGAAWHQAMATLSRRRDMETALSHYASAQTIIERVMGPDHPDAISNLCWWAHTLQAEGELAAAEPLLLDAYDRSGRCKVERPGVLSAVTLALGNICVVRGDTRAADRWLHEALAIQQSLPGRMPLNLGLRDQVGAPYESLTDVALSNGDFEAAWRYHEAGTGWVMETLERSHCADTARRDSLRAAVLLAEREFDGLPTETGFDPDREQLHARLFRNEARLWLLERNAITSCPPHAASLGDVQRAVAPDEAVVGWFIRRQGQRYRVWGYVIRHEGQVHWVRLTKTAEGDAGWNKASARAAEALRAASTWPQRVPRDAALEDELHEVWCQRLQPLLPYLDGVRTLIIPSRDLTSGFSIGCLFDGDRFVTDRFEIIYTPSMSCWARGDAAAGASIVSRPVLAVGDPVFGGEPHEDETSFAVALDDVLIRGVLDGTEAVDRLPRLPMSRREVLDVASIFSRHETLLEGDATESRLDAMRRNHRLEDFGTIHIATHALIHPVDPEKSALALTPSDGVAAFNGLLTAREIMLSWHLDADLVVLSGCQTGRGGGSIGDGFVGFHQAVLSSGARNLMTSLWSVDDGATMLFMARFYANLAAPGATKSGALREAQCWLREYEDENGKRPFEHIVYWGGFVLVGSSR